MDPYLTPGGVPYPDWHTFTFDADRLDFKLRRCSIDDLRASAFAILAHAFLANPRALDPYTRLLEEIRARLRDAHERGQFVFYCRHSPTVPPHERLLLIDRRGVEWTFVRADAHHTYQFADVFCRAVAGDPLLEAARVARNRFVLFAGAVYAGETWSDFRFGWADFWKSKWQSPLPVIVNPLEKR